MAKKTGQPKKQVHISRKPGSTKVEATGTMPTADLAENLNAPAPADVPVLNVPALNVPADEKNPSPAAETSCIEPEGTRESETVVAVGTNAPVEPAPASTEGQTPRRIMELTFTKNTQERKSQAEVYTTEGYPGSIRFSKTLFPTKVGPDQITINTEFREPRKEETKEERKARLKAMPKPTEEQRLQKIEATAAKLREKIAKKQAAGQTAAA